MEKFAFIIHPISVRRDVARKYPIARYLPESWVSAVLPHISPKVVSSITGVRSNSTGTEAEGWFIACPLTPQQLLTLPTETVYRKLVECGKIAEDLGAKILGLGALTSVVGDGGITVAERLSIAVTTGNSYTVATAVEGAKRGGLLMDTPTEEAHIAIVGASGSIGHTCALLLAKEAQRVTLIGRNRERLLPVAREIAAINPHVHTTENVQEGLEDADIILTVTSSADTIIEPEYLKSGAVVCDVARPRDVSMRVHQKRPDVLVIEGGVVSVPGDVDFHFDFGFPPKTAYACMSETMMLALEGRYESFTLGKTVSIAQAEEMHQLAVKHGFRLAGFRSFERAVTDDYIASVRRAAGLKPK
jgi:predicted amino acid dehydrogenase